MIADNFNLKGKTAIVTGPRIGIGRAIALSLAQCGADIAGVGSNPMPETKEQVESLGVNFLEIIADLSVPTEELFENIVQKTLNAFGRIDILINNSGIIRRSDSIDFTEKDWDDVMNVNSKSIFFLTQRVAKEFMRQGWGGKVVNIASMLSYQGGIRAPSYVASKHAVMGITKILANEWAKYGINVNAVAPGYIETANTKALKDDPVRSAEILARIPAGRWGVPSDIGDSVVFLCTKSADYIHGFTLAVDGGWLSR